MRESETTTTKKSWHFVILEVRNLYYRFGKILLCIFICNISLQKFRMGFSKVLCLHCVVRDFQTVGDKKNIKIVEALKSILFSLILKE